MNSQTFSLKLCLVGIACILCSIAIYSIGIAFMIPSTMADIAFFLPWVGLILCIIGLFTNNNE